jgi:hypothetical protein
MAPGGGSEPLLDQVRYVLAAAIFQTPAYPYFLWGVNLAVVALLLRKTFKAGGRYRRPAGTGGTGGTGGDATAPTAEFFSEFD